jgi:hypothetical protein
MDRSSSAKGLDTYAIVTISLEYIEKDIPVFTYQWEIHILGREFSSVGFGYARC